MGIATATLLGLVAFLAPSASLAASCYDTFTRSQFPYCEQLSDTFALHWSVSRDNKTLTLGLVAETKGWAGIGFSESGGMSGATIYSVERNSSSTYTVNNYFSTEAGVVRAGKSTATGKLLSASNDDGLLSAVFTKPLDGSCDYNDLRIQSGYLTPVIWAFGSSDKISYHRTNRGDTQITFIPPEISSTPTLPSDSAVLELTMSKTEIPNTVTNYLCTFHALPNATKYHIVRAEPIIDQAKYLHHMILYGCTDAFDTSLIGKVTNCASMNSACTTFMIGWAPGAGTADYPEEAGFPIGTGKDSLKYFALQAHYNNVNKDAGKIDSSGMRLTYTAQLRRYDLGVLFLGTTSVSIPAAKESYSTSINICPSGCTSQFPQDLTIVSHGYHMHEIGRQIWTKVIRNGVEVPNPFKNYYDFNYQSGMKPHPDTPKILRGDTLLTRCTYDSTSRNTTTRFGEATQDEMCFNFMVYYPYHSSISFCMGMGTNGYSSCSTQESMTKLMSASRNQTLYNQILNQQLQDGLLVVSKMPEYTPILTEQCELDYASTENLAFAKGGFGLEVQN